VDVDRRVTVATPEGVDLELVLAGLGSRFLARLFDTVIQVGAIIALALALAALTGSVGGTSGWLAAAYAVLVFGVLFGYDLVFEALGSGRSPGKRAAGIRVVGAQGEPIGFLTAAIRNALRLFDFLPAFYFVAIVAVLTTDRNQRVGDVAAGTLVVREKFGGYARTPPRIEAPITVPLETVAVWDVTAISATELAAIRQFLARRLDLPWHIRIHLASDLVARLAPKLAGVPLDAHPEFVLEGVALAKGRPGS